MRPLVGVLVGIVMIVLAGGAHAADPVPPQAAPPPPYPPPPASAQRPPSYPPPPGGFAPYGAPYAAPYAYPPPPPPAMYYYDAQKKNELLALVIEFFVPGVGSIYADHVAGAMVTWGLTIGGVVLAFWWLSKNIDNQNDTFGNDNGPHDVWAVYLAIGMILGGRIYGLVDSYVSARDFNRRLRTRLGLPEFASVGVVPIRVDRTLTWGPALSFRF
jgi:hypothetical protein